MNIGSAPQAERDHAGADGRFVNRSMIMKRAGPAVLVICYRKQPEIAVEMLQNPMSLSTERLSGEMLRVLTLILYLIEVMLAGTSSFRFDRDRSARETAAPGPSKSHARRTDPKPPAALGRSENVTAGNVEFVGQGEGDCIAAFGRFNRSVIGHDFVDARR